MIKSVTCVVALLLAVATCLPADGYDYRIKKADYLNTAYYPKDLTKEEMEAEIIVSSMPFEMPTKMGTSQKVAAVKLAKSIVKPILKSKEFRRAVQQLENAILTVKNGPEVKAYVAEILDGAQTIYENSDATDFRQFLSWVVAQMTSDETARSMSSLLDSIAPALQSWIVDPIVSYYKSYVAPSVNRMTKRVSSIMGDEVESRLPYGRAADWDTSVDVFVDRLWELASGFRQMVDAAATFLEMQDAMKGIHSRT